MALGRGESTETHDERGEMEVKKRQNRKVSRETGKAGNDLLPVTGNYQTEIRLFGIAY